jgi:hypothetical protein
MVNRSKIVIDVEPFFCSNIPHSMDAAEPHAVQKSRLNDRVNCLQPTSVARHAAPHRFQMVTYGMV